MGRRVRQTLVVCACIGALTAPLGAQDNSQGQHPMQDMPGMDMSGDGWRFAQDGLVLGLLNRQGGPRGGSEVRAPNWWMGMLMKGTAKGDATLSAMFSLDPATVGRRGYREIFQAGETLDGVPIVDRQHPHDLFMQLAASWRAKLSDGAAVTISGGPVAAPALGPVAYMHRPSAAGLALTPLGHHSLDATHISFGVVTAGVETRRWTAEASIFNGREPDGNRWDFDFARLDSVSGRLTFRPTPTWSLQVSSGHLVDPEELHPGDVVRTTGSASWIERSEEGGTAWTVGFGMNAEHNSVRGSAFAEWSRERRLWTSSARVELVQLDGDLFTPESSAAGGSTLVGAVTVGAVRRVMEWHGVEGGVGANGTVYAVPESLHSSHGVHPASFQLFVRIRPAQSLSNAAMHMVP